MVNMTVISAVVTLTGVLGVPALTGLVGYRIARWNMRKDLEVELRRQRLEAF
jgi:hypothetical protein